MHTGLSLPVEFQPRLVLLERVRNIDGPGACLVVRRWSDVKQRQRGEAWFFYPSQDANASCDCHCQTKGVPYMTGFLCQDMICNGPALNASAVIRTNDSGICVAQMSSRNVRADRRTRSPASRGSCTSTAASGRSAQTSTSTTPCSPATSPPPPRWASWPSTFARCKP